MSALQWLFKRFGWEIQLQSVHATRSQVGRAVVNKLAATGTSPLETEFTITHAQCIDSDHIRLYIEGGRQFCLTVTEIE